MERGGAQSSELTVPDSSFGSGCDYTFPPLADLASSMHFLPATSTDQGPGGVGVAVNEGLTHPARPAGQGCPAISEDCKSLNL